MTHNFLSTLWDSVAPGIANHLWQSTLVALATGLVTLAFRSHRARARYWMWLAASFKFLVPFSVLVALGRSMAWLHPESAKPAFYYAVEEIGQPFAPSQLPVAPHMVASSAASLWSYVTPALLVLWFAGFLGVLVLWIIRWRGVSAAIKSAEPVSEGREIGALRRIERLDGIGKPISVLISRTSLEPGIFGIYRPVLIWPKGISHRLEDAHLEAILAHEVRHVRRRDNLFALLHMLVEAVFWFYPLVWWLGARLVEERERACDEEVLELGGDRQVYAESILKVCEFCLSSPLVCVSGVTGADLKRRMVHIMSDRMLHRLNLSRKVLLATAAFFAVAIPITFGIFQATPSQAQSQGTGDAATGPSFASVSLKHQPSTTDPNRSKMMFDMKDGSFAARGVTLRALVELAYHAQGAELIGGPEWINTAKFDLDAKTGASFKADAHQHMADHMNSGDPVSAMFKALLADQFKLALHPETRNLAAYELVADSSGPKLQESKDVHMMRVDRGALTSQGIPMVLLAQELSRRLGRPVIDRTGLKGHYAFDLKWTPDPSEDERLRASEWQGGDSSGAVPSGPPLMEAVQQQLGLKLVPVTEPVQVLVIDHAELPAEN